MLSTMSAVPSGDYNWHVCTAGTFTIGGVVSAGGVVSPASKITVIVKFAVPSFPAVSVAEQVIVVVPYWIWCITT